MNRPVLRLQVKQETLERQGIMTNGGSIHMVSKGTLRNIARESGICAGKCAYIIACIVSIAFFMILWLA